MEIQASAEPRLNLYEQGGDALKAMLNLEHSVRSSGLESSLLHLVKTRASQINGCAHCIFMHTRDARAEGELEQRLYMLDAWRESSLYSNRERAALAWTEAITNIQDGHAPEEIYQVVNTYFKGEELVKLTLAIITINAWNRLAIGFRIPPDDI